MNKQKKNVFYFVCSLQILHCFQDTQANTKEQVLTKKECVQESALKVVDKEDELVSILTQKKPTVIMCSMQGCGWCTKMAPILETVAQKFPHISFYKIDARKLHLSEHITKLTSEKKSKKSWLTKSVQKIAQNKSLLTPSKTLQIPGFPTFLFIQDGQLQNIQVGGCTQENLEKQISQLIK